MYKDGRVCISILHSAGDDPHGYETAAERWSPVQSVRITCSQQTTDRIQTHLPKTPLITCPLLLESKVES